MVDETRVCRCCRGEIRPETKSVLCHVCRIWNRAKDLLQEVTPAWQRHLQQHQKSLMTDADDLWQDWQVVANLLPEDVAWAELLRGVSGRDDIRCGGDNFSEHAEIKVFHGFRDVLAQRGSPLFPNTVGTIDIDGELRGIFGGHMLVTKDTGLVVDGVLIERGPGEMLFRLLAESTSENCAERFLNMMQQIEGTQIEAMASTNINRREMLRDGRFLTVGASDSPRSLEAPNKQAPPPLCDWNCERWLLGIEVGIDGRHLIPLPKQPALMERFLSIWAGRPNMRVSDRLRALCLQWGKRRGAACPNATISPRERSFSLLRSIVDANSERVRCTRRDIEIDGNLGVTWIISPGQGAHNTPYRIRPAIRPIQGDWICIFDQVDHLPLGDRIASTVLSFLNDDKLVHQFPQVSSAVHQIKRLHKQTMRALRT